MTIQLLPLTPEVFHAPSMVSHRCSDDRQWSRRYPGGTCFSGRSTVLGESPAQMHVFSDSQAANQAVQNPKRPASTYSLKFTTMSPSILMMIH